NQQPKPSQGAARKAGRKVCPFRGASVPVSRLLRSLAPPKAYPCRLEHCCFGGSGRANETPASGVAPERESERETPTQKKTMTKNMNIRSKNVRTQRRRRVGERRCVRRRHRWSQCQTLPAVVSGWSRGRSSGSIGFAPRARRFSFAFPAKVYKGFCQATISRQKNSVFPRGAAKATKILSASAATKRLRCWAVSSSARRRASANGDN